MFLAPALSRCLPAPARPLLPVSVLSAAFRRFALLVGCLAVMVFPSAGRAQSPGAQDTTFTSIISGATFYALTLQNISGVTDVFIAGEIHSLGQLTPDGTDTTTFDFTTLDLIGNELGRIIYTVAPEVIPNGTDAPKLLLGGLFGRSTSQIKAKTPAQNVVRIFPNGVVDTTFNPGAGANNYVTSILPLSAAYDGGIVVGGIFDQFNKQNHGHIVRLDNLGNVVPSTVFDPSLDFDDTVLSLATQTNPAVGGPQGQILVAGTFSNVNGTRHNKLARVNADGSVDQSFNPTFSDRVRIVTSQPDGKILAGGDFDTVNGQTVKHLVRLNYDGSIDTSFIAQVTTQPPLIPFPVAVNTITPLGDGRYYIGGNFAQINGVNRRYLGRIRADGSVDEFDPGLVITNTVQQVAVDAATNLVYVAETRSKSINDIFPPSLIRLFGDPLPVPKVSVKAPVTTATTGPTGQDGRFTLVRTNTNITQPLNVYVTLSGTGTLKTSSVPNGNFTFRPALKATDSIDGATTFLVTFPADVGTLTVGVHARQKTLTGTRTVGLTVQLDQTSTNPYTETYTVGKTPTSTVTLSR